MTEPPDISQSTSETAPPNASKRRIHILGSLRGHKFLVFVIFSLFTGIGTAVIISLPPVYHAEAILEVLPNYVGNLSQDRELELSRSRAFLTTQVHAIKNYDVLLDAALRLREQKEPETRITADTQEWVEQLQRSVEVEQIPQTYRIIVSFSNDQPEGLADTVNAVVNAYQEKMIKNKFIGKDLRINNLTERKGELQAELRTLTARKDGLAEELGPLSFGDQLVNPYDQILIKAMESHAEAQRNRLILKNTLAVVESRIRNLDETKIPRISRQMLQNDATFNALSTKLKDRLTVLEPKLASLAAHPGRSLIEKEIAAIEAQLAEETAAAKERMVEEILNEQIDKLELEVITLKEKTDEAQFLEERLEAEVQEQKRKSTHFTSLYDETSNLQKRITRVRNQISAIEDRLDFFELEENAPGFVNIVSLARNPEKPLEGKTGKLLIVLLFAAITLSSSVAIAIDYFNPWVQSPSDIEAILRYPPLAWISEYIHESSNAFTNDQKRRLALAIQRVHTSADKKCFALTSVKPGGGTTTLTLEIAQQLTHLGVKTLAVEANAFKPDSAYTINRNKPGLIAALTENVPLKDIILPKTDTLPERIPIGDTRGNRHLWINNGFYSLYGFFSLLRNSDYDLILFDIPPVLVSSDAELLGDFADVTLLIVEAEGVTQGEVKRAEQLLDQVSPSFFAVILNRVRPKPGSGYFSKLNKEYDSGTKLRTRKKF